MLPEHLVSNADALARFEREAKAVAALNHPNILGIYDFLREGDVVFAVMELLEGESLRERLTQGPLPPRKAIELAVQMAHGLAAAHEKGVIHRDLKPDNLWITKDGRLKILDFGLAKQVVAPGGTSGPLQETLPLAKLATETGVILGTVGYMSPEQVRGETLDPRSDIFAFGVVLWEMLAGRRPFEGPSGVETLHAILRNDAPPLPGQVNAPPGVERLLSHCLEKLRDARFHSANDLAFSLETLLAAPSGALSGSLPAATYEHSSLWNRLSPLWVWAGLAIGVASATFLLGRRTARKHEPPGFQALLKQPETYTTAVVAPGGRSILFTLLNPDGRRDLMAQDLDVARPRSLGIGGYEILGASPKGVLALLRYSHATQPWGMMATAPPEGGAPRDVADGVATMAWHPDGIRQALIVNRPDLAAQLIEFPAGKEVYRVPYGHGMEERLAFSPDGNTLAFIEGVGSMNDQLHLLDLSGKNSRAFSIPGISSCLWTGAGLFILLKTSDQQAVVGRLDPRNGSVETLARIPGPLEFLGTFPDGDLLVGTGTTQGQLHWERNGLALRVDDITGMHIDDMDGIGDRLVFSRGNQEIWMLDGGSREPTLLGSGQFGFLSPEGDSIVARILTEEKGLEVAIYPVGQGQSMRIPGIFANPFAYLLPGGKKLVVSDRVPNGDHQLRIMTLDGTVEKEFGAFRMRGKPSPDGKVALVFRGEGRELRSYLQPLQGGEPKPLEFQSSRNRVIGWLKDSSGFYWGSNSPQLSYEVHLFDLKSGKDRLWKVLTATSAKGTLGIQQVQVSSDGQTYAYHLTQRVPAMLYRLKVPAG